MNPSPAPTVYIVDDDEDLREALSMLMRAAGLSARSFADARDFLHHLPERGSGCLVLDIRMPGMSGIDLQAELHKRRVRLPIVFLTGHGDVPLAVRAMKAGAIDFIQKPLDEHRLVVAVMNALRQAQADPMPATPRPGGDGDRLDSLSKRELEVLRLMVAGRQSREIAETLCISLKTVEFHRANIREKLGVSSLPELFRLVFGRRPAGSGGETPEAETD